MRTQMRRNRNPITRQLQLKIFRATGMIDNFYVIDSWKDLFAYHLRSERYKEIVGRALILTKLERELRDGN